MPWAHSWPVPQSLSPQHWVGQTQVPDHYQVHDHVARTEFVRDRDPRTVLATLAEREIRHVWLEGGPRLAGAFWNAGLVDRVVGYIAPAMLGSGRAALEGQATTLADLRRIRIDDLRRIGPDIRIVGTPESQKEES